MQDPIEHPTPKENKLKEKEETNVTSVLRKTRGEVYRNISSK